MAFRDDARAWLSKNAPLPNLDLSPEGLRTYALNWQRRQFDGGWAGLSWPVEHGGRGLSSHEQIIWYEEYSRAEGPSILDAGFVAQLHAGPTLIHLGTASQKAFHLPKILRGDVLWCQGFSEPGAGSDLASLKTKGEVRGDKLVVSGQKLWSGHADISDYQELLVRTNAAAERHHGLTWVICDMHAPGVTVRPIKNIAGCASFSAVFYDEVSIPLNQVVGSINDGWRVAMATLGFERGTASIALQIELQQTIEKLIAHTDISALEPNTDIRPHLTKLWYEVAALRSLTYDVIAADLANPSAKFESSMIRLRYAELLQDVQRLAYERGGVDGLRIGAGHSGFTQSYLYSLHDTIAGGTSEIQRNIIAERILLLPRSS